VVGTMGVLQALEAIKVLTRETNEPTPPSLLIFSAYSSPQFRTIKLRSRRPNCAVCSGEASVTLESIKLGSMDYVFFCGIAGLDGALSQEERITPLEYRENHSTADRHVIDVREKVQFDICSLDNSINIPFSQILASTPSAAQKDDDGPKSLPAWLPSEVAADSNSPIYVVCRQGNDSQTAVRRLKDLGLDRGGERLIVDIKGGFRSWREQVDPEWPDY
jgi:adenylyltransferase/sulfurtransferase